MKITGLCVYPFKGIFTDDKPQYIDIGEFGVKYDRELQVMPCDKSPPLAPRRHQQMAFLR